MEFALPKQKFNIIKVVGVGGGGGNAVNNMFVQGIKGVDFVVANTDIQDLERSPVPAKVRLGINQTEGLGAGQDPLIGKISAQEAVEDFREALKNNTKMVFITAGLGGGTGTGAAPILAGVAKSMNILTVGIITTPFVFEGPKRMRQALLGIEDMRKNVDTLLIISNERLTGMFPDNITAKAAFSHADQVLCNAAKGIAEVITVGGYINVDFADVRTVMKDSGTALMGTAVKSGENRSLEAAEAAICCPLLNNADIRGAKQILVNITATEDSLTLKEIETINRHIQSEAGDEVDIIFGTVYDSEMGENLRVTVIATGFGSFSQISAREKENSVPVQAPSFSSPLRAAEPAPAPRGLGVREPEVKRSKQMELTLNENSHFSDEPDLKKPHVTSEVKHPGMGSEQKWSNVKENSKKVYTKPDVLTDLEKEPAFRRRGIELNKSGSSQEEISKYYLEGERSEGEEEQKPKSRLKEGNPFLHNNVD